MIEQPTKPKKDVSHLKQYQWKKGYRPPGSGTKKGMKRWTTELTLQVLMDAALLDPDTGKTMTAKQLKKRLSRHIWSDARILLNYLDRKLGKVADKVDQQVTFILGSSPAQDALTHTVTDDKLTIEVPALPPGDDSNDNSDS